MREIREMNNRKNTLINIIYIIIILFLIFLINKLYNITKFEYDCFNAMSGRKYKNYFTDDIPYFMSSLSEYIYTDTTFFEQKISDSKVFYDDITKRTLLLNTYGENFQLENYNMATEFRFKLERLHFMDKRVINYSKNLYDLSIISQNYFLNFQDYNENDLDTINRLLPRVKHEIIDGYRNQITNTFKEVCYEFNKLIEEEYLEEFNNLKSKYL